MAQLFLVSRDVEGDLGPGAVLEAGFDGFAATGSGDDALRLKFALLQAGWRKSIGTMKLYYAIALIPFFVASCAQDSLTGDTVSRGEAGRAQDVRTGTITAIRPIRIEGGTTGGTLVGAGVGGLLGNQVGRGSGRTAATVGGALVGGAAGSHVGQNVTSRNGLDIEVRLDQGRNRISVVQEVNPRESFSVGDRVRVISGAGGRDRVTH